MAPMLPSARLVWWSSTKLSIPESLSNICRKERRTGSLVRNSSFITSEPCEAGTRHNGAALDRSPRQSMLAAVNARQADRVAIGPPAGQEGELGVDRVQAGRKPSLDPLAQLLGSELECVNRLIVERMQSSAALIPQLAGHIIAGGGKRLRPMLTLGCARLCKYSGSRHIGLAAAVEFIHTATLLHDDVVDASDLRRGRDTANALWGNKPAILVGDFLFSRSFELMVADGSLRILEILSRASSIIAEGEVLQLRTQNDLETTETAYLEVIQAKTAELFAAASRIGAVLAARPSEEEAALDRFGRSLGIAFQLVDDMLDFSARQTEFGKSIGDDFREGNVTLPILLAFARGDEAERVFWRRALEEMDQRPGDLEHAIELIERRGALAETLLRARGYAATAIDALSIFHDGVERRALVEAAAFATERSS